MYVDVGIDGSIFGTGDLSRRMHGALMTIASRKFGNDVPDYLRDLYLLYSMDASAKEAVKAAMDGNGYALDLENDEQMQDEGSWGRVDGVMLIGDDDGDGGGNDAAAAVVYPSFAEAIARGGWTPGTGYSFVVREVPARKKAMDLAALLRALDPDGSLAEEARERGIVLPGGGGRRRRRRRRGGAFAGGFARGLRAARQVGAVRGVGRRVRRVPGRVGQGDGGRS